MYPVMGVPLSWFSGWMGNRTGDESCCVFRLLTGFSPVVYAESWDGCS